jgi:DNA-binding CsgD family transcriptional regulator
MGKSLSNDQKSEGIGISKQDLEFLFEKIANTSLLLTVQSSNLVKINHELMELLDTLLLAFTNSHKEEKNIKGILGVRNGAYESLSLSEKSSRLSSFLHDLKENDNLKQCKSDQNILNDCNEILNRICDIHESSLYKTLPQKRYQSLTYREQTILSMIFSGMNTEQIAESLHLSPFTIKTHRRNIRKKLDLVGKQKDLATYFKSKEYHGP